VHDVLVGHVAVGEIDLGHVEFADERVELFLGVDGDAVRIELSGQDGRILAAFDVGIWVAVKATTWKFGLSGSRC